jgi:hypothetical protein
MPDLDCIPRPPAPGWQAAARLLAGNAADDEIAKEILHSLSHALRSGQGLPYLSELVGVVNGFAEGQLAYSQAMTEVRGIVPGAQGHYLAKVAERAVGYVLVDVAGGEIRSCDHQIFAERFLWCLADHSLIDRRRPELVGTKYANYTEAFSAEERYRAVLAPKVRQLATRLVQDPRATHLHAPAMTAGRRQETPDRLDKNLVPT